jgi:dolichol-phosphate mannosyltransferase
MTEIMRLGFSPRYLPYHRPLGLNEKKSRWTFKKKLKLATDMFLSSSSFPIKAITVMGFVFATLAVGFGVFHTYITLFGNQQFWGIRVPGWTTIVVATTFFGGMTLLSLGIIAEYVWRIYEEVKARPGYIVRKKKRKLAADSENRNENIRLKINDDNARNDAA